MPMVAQMIKAKAAAEKVQILTAVGTSKNHRGEHHDHTTLPSK